MIISTPFIIILNYILITPNKINVFEFKKKKRKFLFIIIFYFYSIYKAKIPSIYNSNLYGGDPLFLVFEVQITDPYYFFKKLKKIFFFLLF
jgi:hypothetical protein